MKFRSPCPAICASIRGQHSKSFTSHIPRRASAFYSDLKKAMVYLSTNPAKNGKQVTVRQELLSSTFNTTAAGRSLMREAIAVIEETIDPLAKSGVLDSRVLQAVQSYK
jgi:hypothetical protein